MTTRTIVLLLAYVATMAAIVGGLVWARASVIARYDNPAALAKWRADTEKLNQQPGRRPVKAEQPPALILMRDNFTPIVAVSVVIGSFLFGFLALAVRGSLRQTTPAADLS